MMSAAPTTGEYFGCQLDVESLEIRTVQNIDRKLLAKEASLYASKWFDYRMLHPAAATYLMVHHYHRAYGEFIGKALDLSRRFQKAFKGEDFFEVHERKSFWRLRQKIDELGIPYPFFLRAAMNWYITVGWGKGIDQPPRPAHIASNSELIIAVCDAWARECRARIQFASSPRYRVAQWVAAPDQVAYEQFMVDQIARKPVKVYALQAALYEFDALRIEAALANFELEDVAGAITHCQGRISHS